MPRSRHEALSGLIAYDENDACYRIGGYSVEDVLDQMVGWHVILDVTGRDPGITDQEVNKAEANDASVDDMLRKAFEGGEQ